MIEIEQYLQAGDIELRAKDIKILLEEHNNMKQDIKRLKEEYMMLQNASDKVEEEKDREIERLTFESTKWESKFYDEAKKVDKAINELNKLSSLYDDNYTVSDKAKDIINILRGGSNE